MSMTFSLWARRSQELSPAEFQRMCASAEILEQDAHGLKVLKLPSGDMLKIFRVKHFVSSARIYSYARRFCRNAARLHRLNIPTVTARQLYRLVGSSSSAVLYKPLPGQTVREMARAGKLDAPLITRLGAFVAELHDLGIYFRSLHFGNIVLTPDNRLGLIDIADMSIFPWKLGCGRRLRNFRHMCRLKEDVAYLNNNGWQIFQNGYLGKSRVSEACASRLRDSSHAVGNVHS